MKPRYRDSHAEPPIDPPEPKPHKGWVHCPECSKATDIDTDFEEQTCEVCGAEFCWCGDEDDEEADREYWADLKLHERMNGD